MTIRRRLTFSFLAILVLFGLNLVIHFWSDQQRSATVETLRRAIARQILIASIKQDLHDLQRQVALLSQVPVEATSSGAGPDEITRFNNQLEPIRQQIEELRDLSDFEARNKVASLEKTYQELSASWRIFYENFGANQAKAVTELAMHAEPLSQRVVHELVPQLEEDEKRRVEVASGNFYGVASLTGRITLLIFIFSTLLAIAVAFLVSRHLTLGLGELKRGAALIGNGDLTHRIAIETRDELGDLGQAFNGMTDNLLSARTQLTQANQELERRHQEAEKQRQVSESLLLNILPVSIAKELQAKGTVEPKYFEDVTILFTDFVGFTSSTEKLAAEDLVRMLHDYFTAFDQIMARYGLEKLKTIGDSYMCVGGLPVRNPSHPVDAVMAAFEMVRTVNEPNRPGHLPHWPVRIGIHTGPVIAGVVGIQKFAFDIWGESVNYASRVELSGVPNQINLSWRTYSRVKDFFECEYRGKVLTKDKKEFNMYFAKGILQNLTDNSTQIPPLAFLHRYRVYFQHDPPAFPAFLLESPPTSSPLIGV
ncbi:MAG: HAMP domain-containing protein [Nitrospirae bacterium]|nr:HAMP domain-containing protein [Nitrospirota bacterium]